MSSHIRFDTFYIRKPMISKTCTIRCGEGFFRRSKHDDQCKTQILDTRRRMKMIVLSDFRESKREANRNSPSYEKINGRWVKWETKST